MLKKSIISCFMIGAVALALASSGGGDKKKSTVSPGVKTLKTTPGFSLKAGRSYSNALTLKNKQNNFCLANSVLTYRKGNTIYILPTTVRYNKQQPVAAKSNLNMLNLKLNLRK